MNIEQQTKLQLKLRELAKNTWDNSASQPKYALAAELLAEFFPDDPLNNPQAKPEAKSNGGW